MLRQKSPEGQGRFYFIQKPLTNGSVGMSYSMVKLIMVKHLNITIYGLVQGVGFRWEASKMAEKCNIRGFVKNEPAGTLYIEAEGEEKDLEAFLAWCRKGPFWSKVEKADAVESPLKNFIGFIIKA